jgi:hypothetical protein
LWPEHESVRISCPFSVLGLRIKEDVPHPSWADTQNIEHIDTFETAPQGIRSGDIMHEVEWSES